MQATGNETPALLILDLDETLIHACEDPVHTVDAFTVGPYTVYKRPGVDKFLKDVATRFDLAIWSSAGSEYVERIADELGQNSISWRFVWSRSRCTERLNSETLQLVYIKDLKKVKRLGYDLARILVIDDSPEKLSRNYGNAVYIKEFTGSATDNELEHLSRYLLTIDGCADFRRVEKRSWRQKYKP